MSTWTHIPLRCPDCGADFERPLLKGIHASRLPQVRADILAGRFQRFPCPACGMTLQVEDSTVYTDFERGHYVAVEPPDPPDWRASREKHVAIFDRCFTFGPPVAEELAHGMTPRLVFGVRALTEKLLAWDAGLDDRLIEGLKGQWLEEQGRGPADEELRLTSVLPGGHLVLVRLEPRDAPAPDGPESVATRPPVLLGHVCIPAWQYERALATRAQPYPWVGQDWAVDVFVTAP